GEALAEDPGIAAVTVRVAIRAPGDHEAAVGEHGDRRLVLGVVLEAAAGVGAGLGAERLAVGVEALQEDVVIATVLIAIRIPRHHEAAAREARHRRLVLVSAGAGIDEEGLAELDTVSIVALAEHGRPAPIRAALVGPHDDET